MYDVINHNVILFLIHIQDTNYLLILYVTVQ